MSIDLYSGVPGSGKSLHTAYHVIEWLLSGRDVIANFPIDMSYFGKKKNVGNFYCVENQDLSVSSLRVHALCHHKPYKESQTLLVIDECASIFNTRLWNAADRMEWIYFFQQHRKLGYEIVLISQSDILIDKQIRTFIEFEVIHRCITNYKWVGVLLQMITFGKIFVAVRVWYHERLKESSQFFRLRKKKAAIYDSYKIFDTCEALPAEAVSPYDQLQIKRKMTTKRKKKKKKRKRGTYTF